LANINPAAHLIGAVFRDFLHIFPITKFRYWKLNLTGWKPVLLECSGTFLFARIE
jgi:hypothetical protein